jgi:acetylglutamate kinase
VVVKIGGELALDGERLARSVGASVRALREARVRVAVVHGAGPQANQLSTRLGITPKLVGGRRVTDEETLEVVKMTLAGQVSVDVAAAFLRARVQALATSGVSAGLVEAMKRPPQVVRGGGSEPVDFGCVGDVVRVNTELLGKLSDAGVVPVLSSLAADAQGRVLNINADTVAARVAGDLRAAKLLMVSNVPGVLRNKDDPSTRIPRLTAAEARAQLDAGVIQGGMIPKVEESLAMLEGGVEAVHIVGLQPEDAVLREAEVPGSCGTALVK